MSALEQAVSIEPANGGVPVSAPEPVAGAEPSPSSAPAPAANETRRETIERNFKQSAAKPRDERGKFAPAAVAAPIAAAPSEVPVAAAPERPAMPKSFKKELESHWNTLPVEFAASVVEREANYEKGVTPLKEKAKVADEFLNEFKPVEHLLRMTNSTPIAAIRDYVRTATIFQSGTPALKAQAVAQIMQQYSVPLEHLQQMLTQGSPAPQTAGVDPSQIHQLVQQEFSSYQQQQAEQQNEAEVERFAADPAYPHFAAVQDWMGPILASDKFRAEHHGKSAQEKLKVAYDLAVRMDPALASPAPAPQPAVNVAAQQVAQARKAVALVKGSPPSGAATKIDPKDRRALIEHSLRNAGR